MTEYSNIAVVVLDTLRKDAFDEHFDWLPGRRYENAWSTSHWTVPAHGSLFTGKYPSEAGVHSKSPILDYPEDTLAERLSAEGYTTRAFSSNVNITPQQNFDRGFDEFTGSWRLDAVGDDYFGWGQFSNESNRSGLSLYATGVLSCILSDAKTLPSLKNGLVTKFRDLDLGGALIDDGARRAKEWLNETEFGNREFLFLNLMEAHSPYLPPREYRSTKRVDVDSIRSYIDEPAVSKETARQAYDDSVRYLSDIYEEMYAQLQGSFDYIVTLSDHGEMLGEHGAWDHLYGVYPELTHIPFVVDGSDLGGNSSEIVNLCDIHSTVLDIAGISTDSDRFSLFDEPTTSHLLTEYHGLPPSLRESLLSDGHNVDYFEGELHGIVFEDGDYGYETGSGFRSTNGSVEKVQFREELDSALKSLEWRDAAESGTRDELQSQLEALGYA